MSATEASPQFGRRLIPCLIDERAQCDLTQPFTSIPCSSKPSDGFKDVSYRQFANAVNHCAWWMQEVLSKDHGLCTIAYTGPSDIRYGILTIASIKTGFKLFLPSPRNSVSAHLQLFDALDCKTYLTPVDTPMIAGKVLSQQHMKHVIVPELEDWLVTREAHAITFDRTFEEARHETFVISHTSGSTGVPKLIEVTHGTFAAQDFFQTLAKTGAPPTILESFRNVRMHLALPLFHAAALFCFFSASVYYNMTCVITPAVPVTAEVVDSVHRFGSPRACCLPPSILVDISKNTSYLQNLRGMEFVMYGGGPLPKITGDNILQVTGTRIFSLLGTTETMLLPLEYSDKEDWDYHRFSPILGAEFRHWWKDYYELFIVRNPKLDLSQAVFATLPDLQEFSPGDLYMEHPTKKGLWRYSGRTDDVIVFVNGEKLNPLTMEGIIESHPEVKSAIIFGTGKFQSGVLLEVQHPTHSKVETASLIQSIWPSIDLANQSCPAHGQILKGMAILTSPEKPMMRAGKGTVQRYNTLGLYRDEINVLYDSQETLVDPIWASEIAFSDQTALILSLRNILSKEIGLREIHEDEDFFSAGLDSLKASIVVRLVNAAAQRENLRGFRLTVDVVYTNPSVKLLSSNVMTLKEQCRPK